MYLLSQSRKKNVKKGKRKASKARKNMWARKARKK